ncbi:MULTISPECIES: permease [unclassified Nesterenkonia]|uniref:permease n=1 Tax=unclassified Nesterenkonia TaxID=2629769 RepID=UPI002103E784|nr:MULTISPECIES: permease [unclassified Nesterenkonia]
MDVLSTFAVLLVELLALFLVVSTLVALVNRRFGPEKLRQWLGSGRVPGPVKGLLLGAITPFCSCSTLPMLVGMLNAGVAFQTAMTFLIASPLLNPIIVGGMVIIFGWQTALVYTLFMIVVALIIPWVWKALGLTDALKRVRVTGESTPEPWSGVRRELPGALRQAWRDLRPLLIPMLIGIAIGATIYGTVPEDQLAGFAGAGTWWAVPLAAVIGIPLYIRLETMLPIALALQTAGVGIGPIFALMIGGAGASPPEVSMLAAIFKPRLLAAFVITIITVAILGGYLISLTA